MSKHYLKYILPLLLLLNSCSYLIKMEEQQASLVDKVQSQKTVICIPSNKQISVVSSNSNAVTSYLGAIKKISKDNNLSLTDKFVLLALWQMNLRPDLSSPYSHLQLLHTVNGKSNYTSFTPIASQMTEDDVAHQSYLNGLEYLLIKSQSRYSLIQIAEMMNYNFPKTVAIDSTMENFVRDNQSELKNSAVLTKYYFKGGQPLRAGETLPRLNFSKVISSYFKQKKRTDQTLAKKNTHLFTYQPLNNTATTAQCNIDLNLYQHRIYPIAPSKITGNSFGIIHSNGESLIAISSQLIKNLASYQKTLLLHDKIRPQRTVPSVLCSIEHHQQKSLYAVISTGERDPGQPLYQLITNWNSPQHSMVPVEQLLSLPRRLHLENPSRLLYESSRGDKKEMMKLLQENRVLLHTRSIGMIWMAANFDHQRPAAMIIDPRHQEDLNCQ